MDPTNAPVLRVLLPPSDDPDELVAGGEDVGVAEPWPAVFVGAVLPAVAASVAVSKESGLLEQRHLSQMSRPKNRLTPTTRRIRIPRRNKLRGIHRRRTPIDIAVVLMH